METDRQHPKTSYILEHWHDLRAYFLSLQRAIWLVITILTSCGIVYWGFFAQGAIGWLVLLAIGGGIIIGGSNRGLKQFIVQPMESFHAEVVQLKQIEQQMEQRNQELSVLQIAGSVITSSLNIQDVFEATTREIANLLDIERCVIFDWDEAEETIKCSARYPHPTNGAPPIEYNLLEVPLVRQVLRDQAIKQITIDQLDIPGPELLRLREEGVKTRLMLPLAFQERVMGLIEVTDSRTARTFTKQEIVLAQLMANQASGAIANARLYEEVHLYLDEITTLNMISQTITSSLNLENTLKVITQHAIRLVGVEAVSVALYDEVNNDIWYAAVSGGAETLMRGTRLPVGQGVIGWVFDQDEPAFVPDVSVDPRFFNELDQLNSFTTRSIICVPLQTKGQTIGAIQAVNKLNGLFKQDDLRLLSTLVAPATTAIVNARLFERSQQEVAERKRAEQTLEEERALLAKRVDERTADLQTANLELARASRLKDEFLASMSHELRTPLTAILGLCELLQLQVHGPLAERQLQTVNNIENSGRHLLALINDILDLSKIEAGKLDIDFIPVSVKTVCMSSLQFIKQLAHKKDIQLSAEFDDAVSKVWADERRLKQILVNLLSNSVKFTPEGGSVGLEVVGDTEKKRVHITIWDTGIGIDQTHLSRIFEPFTQLDSSLSRQHAGTGLGLALVARMVALHKGDISVESEPNTGSRFTISLPWELTLPDLEDSLLKNITTPTNQYSKTHVERTTNGPLILITEDDRSITALFRDYLLAIGYQVNVAYDGVEALQKIDQQLPDLILLDIQMPEMDGLAVMNYIRNNQKLAHIPIVVLTAQAMTGDRERFLEAGANEYLSKPVNLVEMAQTIQTQLDQFSKNGDYQRLGS